MTEQRDEYGMTEIQRMVHLIYGVAFAARQSDNKDLDEARGRILAAFAALRAEADGYKRERDEARTRVDAALRLIERRLYDQAASALRAALEPAP